MNHFKTLIVCISLSTLLITSLANAEANKVEVSEDAEAVDEAYADGYLRLLDEEAHIAMNKGKMVEARRLFARLIALNPNDARAQREFGRTSAAMGKLREAVDALGKCNELRQGAPDPELHFIRGESLFALGEEPAALAELQQAEAELAVAPVTRQTRLWQARIHALRNEVQQAEAIYLSLRTNNPHSASYREVTLLLAEAYIMAQKLDAAKEILTNCAALHDDSRVRELLAWVLELRGDNTEETQVRAKLSVRWDGAQAAGMVGYARSLERSEHYQDALDSYRSASVRGNVDVRDDIARIESRISPEVMAMGEVRNDPTGTSSSLSAGGVVYAADRLRLSAIGAHEVASETNSTLDRGTVSAMLGFGRYNEAGVSAVGWRDPNGDTKLGVQTMLHTNPARTLRAYAMGSYNEPWTESTATLRNGASASSVELQVYSNLFTPRLVATSSLRARYLELPAMGFSSARTATELFGSVGLDWIALVGNDRLRGHTMDNRLLRAAPHNEALIISYRHNEVATDGNLGARIGLVQRSTVDEVSGTARTIIDPNGVLGLGATGGVGYDARREARLWRVGGEVLLALTGAIHLRFKSELARESTAVFTGRRFLTQIGLHADF